MASSSVKHIYVALWQNGSFKPAGIIAFNKENNVSGFQYLSSYDGAPIDPINLNYQKTGTRMFKVDGRFNADMLHRVFQDHLPGAWGMSVLMGEFPELKQMTAAEQLHWFGSRTVGGMSCRVGDAEKREYPNTGFDRLMEIREKSIALAARKIAMIDNRKTWWGLCSHGGARPKTSFVDDNGDHWIVKFNQDFDGFNSARVEHALSLAANQSGLPSVETKVMTLPDGEDVLFIKRFDRSGNDVTGSRAHQISLYSLLDESRIRQPNAGDYADLIRAVRLASSDPENDSRKMFHHMLFNVAVNNTDDHAKNFGMVLTSDGYRLSQAYDLTTNVHPYPHSTSIFGLARADLDERTVLALAGKAGIPADDAIDIREQIVAVLADFYSIAAKAGLSDADVAMIEKRFYGHKSQNENRIHGASLHT